MNERSGMNKHSQERASKREAEARKRSREKVHVLTRIAAGRDERCQAVRCPASHIEAIYSYRRLQQSKNESRVSNACPPCGLIGRRAGSSLGQVAPRDAQLQPATLHRGSGAMQQLMMYAIMRRDAKGRYIPIESKTSCTLCRRTFAVLLGCALSGQLSWRRTFATRCATSLCRPNR